MGSFCSMDMARRSGKMVLSILENGSVAFNMGMVKNRIRPKATITKEIG